jgi:hypothetical protein
MNKLNEDNQYDYNYCAGHEGSYERRDASNRTCTELSHPNIASRCCGAALKTLEAIILESNPLARAVINGTVVFGLTVSSVITNVSFGNSLRTMQKTDWSCRLSAKLFVFCRFIVLVGK